MAHGGAARARLVAEISIVVEMRATADRFDMARIGRAMLIDTRCSVLAKFGGARSRAR